MSHNRIILASASPRRVDLLRAAGLVFEVVPSRAEELHDERLAAAELCAANALRKAAEVARHYPAATVVGADTLVTLEGALFGKPKDRPQAQEMLERLSGRTHEVITGVAMIQHGAGRQEVFTDSTRVTFRPLSAEIIRAYLTLVPVLDKAGAYAIQERGEMLVKKIEGSLSNVIGLPLETLAGALARWDLILPHERDRIAAASRFPDLQI